MRWAALIAATLLAVVAPAACADPFGPAEEAAYQQAEAFWQRQPTNCTSIAKEVGVLAGGEDSWASVPSAPGPCRIEVAPGLSPPWLCEVMTHEYGHLLGLGHSTDPADVMYPVLGALASPICAALAAAEARVAARRQAWSEWRERRAGCRAARGPYERRCWREVRRRRLALQRA